MHLIAGGIDHLNLEVKDLNESINFYKDLFGFEVLKDQPDQNSKIIGSEKVKLCLYENPELDLSQNQGFNHFGFFIDNFDQIKEKCQKMNVSILYGGAINWEKSASFYITDPNGYEIELAEIFGGGL